MTQINIKIDDADVAALFKRLHAKVSDMTPVMEVIGQIVRTSVVGNFEEGGRYSEPGNWRGGNKRWAPLSISTLFAGRNSRFAGKRGRFKKGAEEQFKGRMTLVDTARLRNSINVDAGRNKVEIGTNVKYAAIHQFGGKAGRGKKINIPARPFLVVQDEDIREINSVLKRYLTEGA